MLCDDGGGGGGGGGGSRAVFCNNNINNINNGNNSNNNSNNNNIITGMIATPIRITNNSYQYDTPAVLEKTKLVFVNTYDGHFSSDISLRHSIASFKSIIANDDDMFHKLGSGLGFGLEFLNDKNAEEMHSRIFVRCQLCKVALMSLKITCQGNKSPLLNWRTHLSSKTHLNKLKSQIISTLSPRQLSGYNHTLEMIINTENAENSIDLFTEFAETDNKFKEQLDVQYVHQEADIYICGSVFDHLIVLYPEDLYQNENDADQQIFCCSHCNAHFSGLMGGCFVNAERHLKACRVKKIKYEIEQKFPGKFHYLNER
jgi:hypothetical protein